MKLRIAGLVLVLVLAALSVLLRPTLVPDFDGKMFLKNGEKYDVRILRDTYGVPHIYGKRDADAAFGLAYAHAEDDFATLQQSLMTSRGRLGLMDNQSPRLMNLATRSLGLGEWFKVEGADPAITDYLVQLLRVRERVQSQLKHDLADGRLSSGAWAAIEAYADGINLYAAQHPDQVRAGFSPVTGEDVVSGFVFFTPLFFGLERHIRELFEPSRQHELSTGEGGGSNAMAVAPSRSSDQHTRLLINSHQPYTGPLAWYEVRVKSEEGWDLAGGVFPGSPFILHGFGPAHGWANTVNTPDLTDVYVLTRNPDNPDQYKFDGTWKSFEKREAEIQLRILGPIAIRVTRPVLWSVHGPVIERDHGTYAIRYATMDRINQVQGYYALNKAKGWDDFEAALKLQVLPSQNFTYADATGRIAYIYNGVFPDRAGTYNWQAYLPGDQSASFWSKYLPFDAVPKVINPPSGFVYNANNHPFMATSPDENLKRENFPTAMGIETRETNRGLRFEELLSSDKDISAEDFDRIKYDKLYSSRSALAKLIPQLVAMDVSQEAERDVLVKAQGILKTYDFSTDANNRGAALAVITGLPVVAPTYAGKPPGDARAAFRHAVKLLTTHFGRLDPTWGEVNRFRRGILDESANGGPDVLRDFEAGLAPGADGRFEANKGDTLYYFVDWDANGRVSARGIHQFGSATLDQNSPHYADQAPIFLAEKTKPIWLDEADLRQNLSREYQPGR